MSHPPTLVFLLDYLRPWADTWTGTVIGVYSSLEEVEQAKERLRRRMGYRDYPDGFRVHCMRLDEDYDEPEFMTNGE